MRYLTFWIWTADPPVKRAALIRAGGSISFKCFEKRYVVYEQFIYEYFEDVILFWPSQADTSKSSTRRRDRHNSSVNLSLIFLCSLEWRYKCGKLFYVQCRSIQKVVTRQKVAILMILFAQYCNYSWLFFLWY